MCLHRKWIKKTDASRCVLGTLVMSMALSFPVFMSVWKVRGLYMYFRVFYLHHDAGILCSRGMNFNVIWKVTRLVYHTNICWYECDLLECWYMYVNYFFRRLFWHANVAATLSPVKRCFLLVDLLYRQFSTILQLYTGSLVFIRLATST